MQRQGSPSMHLSKLGTIRTTVYSTLDIQLPGHEIGSAGFFFFLSFLLFLIDLRGCGMRMPIVMLANGANVFGGWGRNVRA